ncbi:hypothetical protein HJC23_012609 [Cyclotella cryptica]|uniref:CAF1B/HIR1 beta-propeller domain-containing protein n=1 Tax=Cyclotella cryptica TaxID=29204 RepID=A0ABD3QMF6_9STRA|eukprot:CCRYP_004139-RA/>CCRYP_004139-RA protein AED:0.02 eAED:0.02 QI:180/1/1/1/1/1/2/111/643
MKVETPQILWHNTQNGSNKENGKSFPILSCDLIDNGFDSANNPSVLATAGGSEVNLWRVVCTPDTMRAVNDESKILVKPPNLYAASALGAAAANNAAEAITSDPQHTQIQHLVTLSRSTNERTINAVKFSPDFSHLAATGDGGLVVVWTLPLAQTTSRIHRSAQWASLKEEKDLKFKILYNQSDDVMDLAWSADSKRFMVCSLDHTVAVFESANSSNNTGVEWRTVFRSSKDHTHYVQGVAYDPKGVYMASSGSDRTVKIYTRKLKECTEDELANKKFELGKAKTVKFLNVNQSGSSCSQNKVEGAIALEKDEILPSTEDKKEKRHLFADELTVGSFFRRLAFTPDGGFLIVPAALWHGDLEPPCTGLKKEPASPKSVDKLTDPSFGTYLFARHCFERPYKVLAGLEKPSVVVRPNPLLFQLPPSKSNNDGDRKALPYRSIFAVLTIDTVLIYDTHHDRPLAMARGLHYAGLTDAAWSADGKTLFVTSSDGYVSILSFAKGELGEVYVTPLANNVKQRSNNEVVHSPLSVAQSTQNMDLANSAAPPAVNVLAPKKKKKVTLNLEANTTTEIENVSNGTEWNPVVVNTLVPKKKKKVVSGTDAAKNESSLSKRPSEEAEDKEQVNVLVPKKKMKVVQSPSEAAN